ncbi:MAG: preprotein translocase subunit SecG [Bacteroidota bacterium]
MYIVVIILIILVCVLLTLVVLSQNSKGGGLSSTFGGSSANQMIGAKKTTDLLERITWGLAAALLVLTLTTNLIVDRGGNEGPTSPNIDRAAQKNVAPQAPTTIPGADPGTPGESDGGDAGSLSPGDSTN